MPPSVQRHSPVAKQVASQFKEYWGGSEKKRLDDPNAQRKVIVAAHRFAMCFSYMSRAMTVDQLGLEPHQRVFFQELTSDAVHLVHALMGGDARGGRFYLRSIIENFWRHHYFRNHVVEYGWLHTRSKYHVEMKDLREHCAWLDCFQGKVAPLMTNLPRLYADLSNAVHSTSSKTLVLRQDLGDIRLVKNHIEPLYKDVTETLKSCLGLCIFSEKNVFLGLGLEVQKYLFESLSAAQKKLVVEAFKQAEIEVPGIP